VTDQPRDEARHAPVTTSITTDATGELLMPLLATDSGPARAWSEAAEVDTLAPPDELEQGDTHLTLTRTFCFADLSGFTAFTREKGAHAAVHQLDEFRRVTRNVATKRGVRVAKWLGDGVMLVGTDPAATIALGAHLIHHFSSPGPVVRVGAATGIALLFDDDDYIGEPVNLAAKLCAAAEPGELLAVCDADAIPDWVTVTGNVSVKIGGVGKIGGVKRLTIESTAVAI
jgi:class 3 adenylate cyclase